MADNIVEIADPTQHEKIIAESKTTPTIICVSHPSTPISQSFVQKYRALAADYSEKHAEGPAVRFGLMEFNRETSMLCKFSPNQLPVVALMCHDRWAKTIMGANLSQVEKALDEMLERSRALGFGGS